MRCRTCLKNNVARKIATLNLVATSNFKKLYMLKTSNEVSIVVKIDKILETQARLCCAHSRADQFRLVNCDPFPNGLPAQCTILCF